MPSASTGIQTDSPPRLFLDADDYDTLVHLQLDSFLNGGSPESLRPVKSVELMANQPDPPVLQASHKPLNRSLTPVSELLTDVSQNSEANAYAHASNSIPAAADVADTHANTRDIAKPTKQSRKSRFLSRAKPHSFLGIALTTRAPSALASTPTVSMADSVAGPPVLSKRRSRTLSESEVAEPSCVEHFDDEKQPAVTALVESVGQMPNSYKYRRVPPSASESELQTSVLLQSPAPIKRSSTMGRIDALSSTSKSDQSRRSSGTLSSTSTVSSNGFAASAATESSSRTSVTTNSEVDRTKRFSVTSIRSLQHNKVGSMSSFASSSTPSSPTRRTRRTERSASSSVPSLKTSSTFNSADNRRSISMISIAGAKTPSRSSSKLNRRRSLLSISGVSGSTSGAIKQPKHFPQLEKALPSFMSKKGIHRSNILRVTLISFLRRHRVEYQSVSRQEYVSRMHILSTWWRAILKALRDKEHPISNADKSLYLEAISGIIDREEWTNAAGATRALHEELLTSTLKFVISKLSLKAMPLSIAAFSGKVIAHSFFHIPQVAPVLLYHLHVSQSSINRILNASMSQKEFSSASKFLLPVFPVHLSKLVGFKTGYQVDIQDDMACSNSNTDLSVTADLATCHQAPLCPSTIPELYGPWVRRWASSNGDVFSSFLKHYYHIVASLLPAELPCNYHLASPGLIVIHSFILAGLDFVVHPRPSMNSNPASPSCPIEDAAAVCALTEFPGGNGNSGGRRRVDQLKVLSAIREILHNDDACIHYFECFCKGFEHILCAVTLKVSLYSVESCVILADLVEEFLSSLTLTSSFVVKDMLHLEKSAIVDWQFWITMCQRMLMSENSHTELRALALLFNVWDKIPINGASGEYSRASSIVGDSIPQEENIFELYCDDEGLRWSCTVWLLSEQNWKKYFCHWNPLVRCYYQRLVCWKFASIGSDCGLVSSIIYSNYNEDTRQLLSCRLTQSYHQMSVMDPSAPVNYVPSQPVLNRTLSILPNPAYSQSSKDLSANPMSQLRRVNPFDVFDEFAYSQINAGTLPSAPPIFRDSTVGEPSTGAPPSIPFVDKNQAQSSSKLGKFVNSFIGKLKMKSSKKSSADDLLVDDVSSVFTRSASSAALSTLTDSTEASETFESPVSVNSSRSSPPSPGTPSSGLMLKFGVDQEMGTESVTSHLHNIPPPEQLLRKIPEIRRSQFKFALEYVNETRSKSRLSFDPPSVSNHTLRNVYPRLPFSRTCNVGVSTQWSHSDRENASHDMIKYWTYCGKALAEWKLTVLQFEEYVRNRKLSNAISRLEDLESPFMIAEIPAKALAKELM